MTAGSSSGATTGIAGVIGNFKSQLVLALLIIVLGVTGWGIHATTERAILDDISSELAVIRDTETTALRMWVDGRFLAWADSHMKMLRETTDYAK